MTWSGSDVVILAARRPIAVALQAVLHDWLVQGLIDPCRIIDLDSLQADDPAIPVTVLSADTASVVSLQQDLAHTKVGRIRLAVVGVVDEEETSVTSQQAATVLEVIRQSLPGVACTQLNISAGSPGSSWAARSVALFGWHNLAISPEESVSPRQGSAPLANSETDPRWLLLLAGTLCSLTGLWPGQETAPLDDQPVPSGGLIVPVRAFSRSLSSNSVHDALAARLVGLEHRYPTPRVDTSFAIGIDNEEAQAQAMAQQLWEKHHDVLPRKRVATPVPEPKKISAWEALRQFFQFALKALANAPRNMLAAIDRSVSRAAASAVQNAVFGGADSNFAVVVRGVRADGSSASWTEYEENLDSVVRKVGASGELPPVPQKHQLWHDFLDAGLTLLDAGNRSADFPPRTLGSQRAVVTTTDVVTANPDNTFTLPPSIAAFLPNWKIEAGDDIAVNRLLARLDHLATTQPHLAQSISAERNRLRSWASEVQSSYAGHVGLVLGQAHRGLIQEVHDLTARIEQLSVAPEPPQDLQAEQETLGSTVRVMTGVTASLAVILVALTWLGVISWPWLVLGLLLMVLGWMIGGAYLQLKASAKEHAYLHRLKVEASQLQDAQRHRVEALEDLRRVSRAYRQYLDWSRVLGAFIHAPLGKPISSTQRELYVGQGLPLNLSVGVAIPSPESIDEVANRWRGELFRVGWLSEAWQEFISDLPVSLGQLRHQLQSDPNLLFNDPSYDRVPVLTQWSKALAQQAGQRELSATFNTRIMGLTRSDAEAREHLLSRVQVRDTHGQPRQLSRTEFVEGLDKPGAVGSFLPGMFNPAGGVVDVRAVNHSLSQEDSIGLDIALVVVQLGGAYDLAVLAGPTGDADQTTPLQPSSDLFI